MSQASAYEQLQRNIVINADIYGGVDSDPKILAAGYGFEGIMGVPGLLSENQIRLAKAHGAGIIQQSFFLAYYNLIYRWLYLSHISRFWV